MATAGNGSKRATRDKGSAAAGQDSSGPKPGRQHKGPANGRPTAANSSSFHYFARRNLPADCKDDRDRIHRTCDSEEGKAQGKKAVGKARLDSRHTSGVLGRVHNTLKKGLSALDGLGRFRSGYKPNKDNQWMDDHCAGLWNKPGSKKRKDDKSNIDDFKEQIEGRLKELTQEYEQLAKSTMEKIQSFATDYFKQHRDEVVDAAVDKAKRRAALTRFPGLSRVLVFYSFWEGMGTLLGNVAGAIATDDMARKFQALEDMLSEARKKVDEYTRLLNGQGALEDAMASTMEGIAMANPCITARKCLLVPFKDSDKTAKGNGCCPGQTGHHVLPGKMFSKYKEVRDAKTGEVSMKEDGPRKCWEKYKHREALTMCLEGTTNRVTNGSHGLAHWGTGKELEGHLGEQDMSYVVARDKVTGMLSRRFGCNQQCLIAQLDDSYQKMHSCGNLSGASVTPHSGESDGGPKPDNRGLGE